MCSDNGAVDAQQSAGFDTNLVFVTIHGVDREYVFNELAIWWIGLLFFEVDSCPGPNDISLGNDGGPVNGPDISFVVSANALPLGRVRSDGIKRHCNQDGKAKTIDHYFLLVSDLDAQR